MGGWLIGPLEGVYSDSGKQPVTYNKRKSGKYIKQNAQKKL